MKINRALMPSGHCPNGTPTLPPPFPPGFDSGGKRLGNLEALGLRVGCYPPPPGPVGPLGCTPEIGGPMGGPAYQKNKKNKK